MTKKLRVCVWHGSGEGCRHPTIYGKSYCEKHYERIYESYYTEIADYIIDKELNENSTFDKYSQK